MQAARTGNRPTRRYNDMFVALDGCALLDQLEHQGGLAEAFVAHDHDPLAADFGDGGMEYRRVMRILRHPRAEQAKDTVQDGIRRTLNRIATGRAQREERSRLFDVKFDRG